MWNLVANLQWTGSYNGRFEEFNDRYEASIDTIDATNPVLMGNYVAASERVGYHVSGVPSETAVTEPYDEELVNIAVSNLMGLAVFPMDISRHRGISLFSGYNLWKNVDYGVYYNSRNSVKIESCVFAYNHGVDIFPMVFGPSSVAHLCEHKTVEVTDSIVIGYSSSMDMWFDAVPAETYIGLSSHCRGVRGPGDEKLGLVFPQLTQGFNKAPEKPCAGVISYNSLCGSMTITGRFWYMMNDHNMGHTKRKKCLQTCPICADSVILCMHNISSGPLFCSTVNPCYNDSICSQRCCH